MKAKVEAPRPDLVGGGEVADNGKLCRGEDLLMGVTQHNALFHVGLQEKKSLNKCMNETLFLLSKVP